jgi:hypothetical protein
MKKHLKVSYHDEIAFKFGSIVKAILLSEIMFWNESKIKTAALKYGLPLVYFSSNAINKKFKSINANTANRLLKQLTNDGILFSCIANSMQRDTTKSYLVNFAYYDAILNNVEYPQIEKDRFTTIAQNAVNTIDKNSKLLCNEILQFLVIQNEYPKIKNGLEIQNKSLVIQNESLVIQNESSEIQNESTLPTNTPSNTPSNKKVIITETNNNQKVKSSAAKKLEIDTDKVKAIYKNQFPTFAINESKYNKSLLNKSISILEANLKTYNAANNISEVITLESNYDNLKRCLKAISNRIDINNLGIMNLTYFNTIIENEPIQNFQDDLQRLLSRIGAEQKANYYIAEQKHGKEKATEILRNLLIKKYGTI